MARRRMGSTIGVTAAVACLAGSVGAQVAGAAAVIPIDPPSGASIIEGPVTLRWDLDVTGCDPGKNAVTQVELEIDGQLAPSRPPEPADSGFGPGLFAAAAGDGFRVSLQAVNVRTDGRPSVYRWRALFSCTGPGVPPDPTAVPIDVVGPWSQFVVNRVFSTPTTPAVPPARTSTPIGPTKARVSRFLGWAPRNRPLPIPFRASQIPRPLTPVGGTMRNCSRGPRGLVLVFRYSGIPRPRAIAWTWSLDGRRLVVGRGQIGGRVAPRDVV